MKCEKIMYLAVNISLSLSASMARKYFHRYSHWNCGCMHHGCGYEYGYGYGCGPIHDAAALDPNRAWLGCHDIPTVGKCCMSV